jgi:hypothetical protein
MKNAKSPDALADELADLERLQAAMLGYPYRGTVGPGSNPTTVSDTPGGEGWTLRPTAVEDWRDESAGPEPGTLRGRQLGVPESVLDMLDARTDDDLAALPAVAALGLTTQRIARLRAVARSAT